MAGYEASASARWLHFVGHIAIFQAEHPTTFREGRLAERSSATEVPSPSGPLYGLLSLSYTADRGSSSCQSFPLDHLGGF